MLAIEKQVPPPSRTNWTRLVPPPVLTGHASSLLPSDVALPPVPPPPAPTTRPRTAPARVPPEVDEMGPKPLSLNVLPKPAAGPRGPHQPPRGASAAERAVRGSASGRRRSGSRYTPRRARPRPTA